MAYDMKKLFPVAPAPTRVINRTPHVLHIFDAGGKLIQEIMPSGLPPARVGVTSTPTTRRGLPIPVAVPSYGEVTGLPDPCIDEEGAPHHEMRSYGVHDERHAFTPGSTSTSYKACSRCGAQHHHAMTYYFVSAMVAQALPERRDLLYPGEVVRDNTGNVVGIKSFSTVKNI